MSTLMSLANIIGGYILGRSVYLQKISYFNRKPQPFVTVYSILYAYWVVKNSSSHHHMHKR